MFRGFSPRIWLFNNHGILRTGDIAHLAKAVDDLDVPFWQDLVAGIEKPIIDKGFIKVPDAPGLGVTLNDDEVKRHLKPGTGYFGPTPMWDEPQSWDDALFS